jgi:ATP-dependent Lhr-like helicase
MSENFSRLSPFIREYVYEHKWSMLHSVQEAAIRAVFDREAHILIASPTASGKTEAAFFPVLSLLSQKPVASVGLLYICPLKALINDQFERLKDLLSQTAIPVWRWHGDVPNDEKQRLLRENPGGILQITPESLEALLLRYPQKIKSLFKDLVFIIVDEVHSFMGSERGSQLICQIARIQELAGCTPRRIGLSATLGDYQEAMDWLALGSEISTILIHEEQTKKKIKIALDYFGTDRPEKKAPKENVFESDFFKDHNPVNNTVLLKTKTTIPDPCINAYYKELYKQCYDRKCIIFTNSRLEAEETIAALRILAEQEHGENIFHVHHGSISKILRQETEMELKEREGPVVTAATQTLEMGIDVGKLDRIIQLGPPVSVSSFVQRLGRAGRRSGIAEIYFTFLEHDDEQETTSVIPWNLLRTIAVIQLYLEEKWIETSAARPFPFSLLIHQTLSILASLGEHRASDLARRVLSLPPFSNIVLEDYRELLRYLIAEDCIQKTDAGTLILGLVGEVLVNRYTFYAIFTDDEAYRVTYEGKELGMVNFLPPAEAQLALAGRYWQVRSFDMRSKTICVLPAQSGGERAWRGSSAELHSRIVTRIKTVLAEETIYPYLSESAAERLRKARSQARNMGLIPDAEPPGICVISDNQGGMLLVPWLGSKGMRTLQLILQHKENRKRLFITSLCRENEYSIHITSELSLMFFKQELQRLIASIVSPQALLEMDKIPITGKYDYLLPLQLRVKQYVAHSLDLEEVRSMGSNRTF